MAKAVHMMVRVLEEARSVAFYTTVFGLAVAQRVDFPDFTLIYMSNAEASFEVELTVNKGRTEPYDLVTGTGTWRSWWKTLPRSVPGSRPVGLP